MRTMYNCNERVDQSGDELDIIVRLHDIAKGYELRRCLFSLICQTYRPATVQIVLQRFTDSQIWELRDALAPTMEIDPAVRVNLWNYSRPDPKDARSALLNLGISKASGRYLAFLDHDDVIYPEAYVKLIRDLADTKAKISFGQVVAKHIDSFQDAIIVDRRHARFVGRDLAELFHDNFCPLHSFVLDRRGMNNEDVRFEEGLSKLEDYDFLLRICASYPSSFSLSGKVIGDYYFKNDGSNTICLPSNESAERISEWEQARKLIEARRKGTVLSSSVQRQHGMLPSDPSMTIRRFVEGFRGKNENNSEELS